MGRIAISIAITAALTFAACEGDTKTASDKTPVAPTASAPAATATPVPIPERPATFSAYAPAIAEYLSADPAVGEACALDALYTAWSMPQITSEAGCRIANVDEDPDEELLLVLTTEAGEPSGAIVTRFTIAVFDRVEAGYELATVLDPPYDVAPVEAGQPISPIVDAGDLNNDGGGEFAFRVTTCGASTCFDKVFVKKGTASGYTDLTPPEGVGLATATIRFEDTDSDGAKELLLTGGEAGSVGAGPQRPLTQVWGWDGFAYVLRSSTPGPPAFLYHAVKDADALFATGQYAPAEAAYLAAIGNPELGTWMPEKNERNELEAYSLFRAALAVLAEGGDVASANAYLDRAKAYPDTLHAQLAGAFQAGYAAKAQISVGCAAVRDALNANADGYAAFWDFGFANPTFNPTTACPF